MSNFDEHPNRRTFRADLEAYKRTRAYYQSIRRPGWEWVTFSVALLASILTGLRIAGVWLIGYGEPLVIGDIVALFAFVGFDSIFAKAHHPMPNPLGGFNPGRIYEKFAMQERAWQLLLVLMIPVVSRMIIALGFLSRRM
jgi:hypothetical protein